MAAIAASPLASLPSQPFLQATTHLLSSQDSVEGLGEAASGGARLLSASSHAVA